jgi:protoporphyrin/coproporphyrin ferrochelatase
VPDIAQRRAVLLLAHGTPESLDQIPEYLRNITSGRPMPESVIEEIRHRYSLIGSSPLTELTLEQGRLLSQALALPVYVGMRNWKPYIADVVRQMRADGITSAVAICLAPQNSRTSVGLYRRAVFAEAAESIEIDFIDGWADHPQLAQAFAQRLQPVWQSLSVQIGSMAPVLFTAHSVPCRTIQTSEGQAAPDPYPVEAKRTAANVAALLAPLGLTAADWFFAFQSQGMSGGTWIGPTVEDTLTALRQEGHSAVVIHPVGFLCDHVEILYDIDIAFRDFAAGIGLEVVRPQSLNDSPLLIAALEDLARQGFARLAAKAHSASLAAPVV